MAIKDWKKITNSFDDTVVFKHKSKIDEITVNAWGTPTQYSVYGSRNTKSMKIWRRVLIDKRTGRGLKSKNFKSKQAALNYVKTYMRKH